VVISRRGGAGELMAGRARADPVYRGGEVARDGCAAPTPPETRGSYRDQTPRYTGPAQSRRQLAKWWFPPRGEPRLEGPACLLSRGAPGCCSRVGFPPSQLWAHADIAGK
jgi:hypothetical protein